MLALITVAAQGCAVTPEMGQDCPKHFTEQKEIDKCVKRVDAREQMRFERQQEEARKKACTDAGLIWFSTGRAAGCITSGEMRDILGGYGSRQLY